MSFKLSLASFTVTTGNSFSFDITPLSALAAAEDVTWEIVGIGRQSIAIYDLLLPSGDRVPFPSGTVSFAAGASDKTTIELGTVRDNFARADKTFFIRLKQGDEVLAESDVITLVDDYAANKTAYPNGDNYFYSQSFDEVYTLGRTEEWTDFNGRLGSDTYIITKYQIGDVKITDISSGNFLKLDFDVVVTQISYNLARGRLGHMFLTLDTGAQIHLQSNGIRNNYQFQIGDGEVLDHVAFANRLSAGGLKADAEDAPLKEQGFLVTPYEVTRYVTFSSSADVSVREDATSLSHQITSPAHDILSYALSGTDAASFTISDSGVLSLASDVTLDADGTKTSYTVSVTITLFNGHSGTQDITVTVTDVNDIAPVFATDTPSSITFDENSALPSTVFAATGDVGTVAYSLSGTDQSAFTIDSATGALSAASGTVFDYETKSSYSFNVVATVGQLTTSHAVTVTLNDVDDPPLITSADSITAWPENTTISKDTELYAATGTVLQGNPAIAWSLKKDEGDSNLFEISAAGKVSLKDNLTPDFEGKSSYSFTVVATSQNLSSEKTVTVAVTDVSDSTHFTSPATVTIPEDTLNWSHKLTAVPEKASDSVTYSLRVFGDSPLVLNGDTISLKNGFAGFDYESGKKTFTGFVSATDSSGNTAGQSFKLNISDVDESPTASAGSATINRENGYSFKASDFNKRFSDPEGQDFDGIIITQLPDEAAGILRLDGAAVTINQTVTLAQIAQLTFTLGTAAAATAHVVPFSYKVKAADSTVYSEDITFSVSIPAIPPPVFTRPVTSFSVEERADSFEVVQYFASADGNKVTFTLSGADHEKFQIDEIGEVTRADNASFDKSDGTELSFNVIATSRGVSASVAVTVTITDIANDTFIKLPASPTILYSSDDDDTITGTSVREILYGDGGNDIISAGGGGDIIIGGYGSDQITLHDQEAHDQLIYRFDSSNKASWKAVDGSDVIKNFTVSGNGKDSLLFVDLGDASDVTNQDAFIRGLIEGGGSFSMVANSDNQVSAMKITFGADGTNDGTDDGASSGKVLTIMFDAPLGSSNSQTILSIFNGDMVIDKDTDEGVVNLFVGVFASLDLPFGFTKDLTPSNLSFDAPLAFTQGPHSLTVAENTTFQTQTFKAVSDDDDAISYSLVSTEAGATDHESFILSSNGVLSAATGVQFDADTKSSYKLTIKASAGSDVAIRELVITVSDSDAAGSAFAGASKAQAPTLLEQPLPLDELELPLYSPTGEI